MSAAGKKRGSKAFKFVKLYQDYYYYFFFGPGCSLWTDSFLKLHVYFESKSPWRRTGWNWNENWRGSELHGPREFWEIWSWARESSMRYSKVFDYWRCSVLWLVSQQRRKSAVVLCEEGCKVGFHMPIKGWWHRAQKCPGWGGSYRNIRLALSSYALFIPCLALWHPLTLNMFCSHQLASLKTVCYLWQLVLRILWWHHDIWLWEHKDENTSGCKNIIIAPSSVL